MVFLGDSRVHPATYKMFLLLEDTSGVIPRPTFPADLLRLIQQDFNESFLQALDRGHRVQWPKFESLGKAIATGTFHPKLVSLLGGITPSERPLPPHTTPAAKYWQHPRWRQPPPQCTRRKAAGLIRRKSRTHTPPRRCRSGWGLGFGRPSTR